MWFNLGLRDGEVAVVVVFGKELIPEELRRFVYPACNMENGRNFIRDIDFKD